ncbi:MAG TPA: MBL fold metallo-hydrolase [Pseudonocardiaceae bacterium]
MRTATITEAAEGVHLVQGPGSNWIILTEGEDVTLIDSGYPGDLQAVRWSLRKLGHGPEDLAAILLTHAHVDHIGSVPGLIGREIGISAEGSAVPVFASAAELPMARGEVQEQAKPSSILVRLLRPGVLGWLASALGAGALRHVAVPSAQAFSGPGPLDVPGHPVPIATPGHTSGHTSYHLPQSGVIVTGDALVTAHAISLLRGPQLLPTLFSNDPAAAVAALDALEDLDAETILPGHGPGYHGPIREAVARARKASKIKAG